MPHHSLATFRHTPFGLFLWLFLWVLPLPAPADDLVAIPDLQHPVTDLTATLTPGDTGKLNDQLQALRKETGAQLAVLLVPTTQPEAIEQYALRVAETWKLGKSKVDNGVLLLVAKNDHALRIEVGYGLEGGLNDATAKRIASEAITPKFKQGLFYEGIQAGVDQIAAVIKAEPGSAPQTQQPEEDWSSNPWVWITLVLGLVGGWLLRLKLSPWKSAGISATLGAGLGWAMGNPMIALGVGGVILLGVGLIKKIATTMASRASSGSVWTSSSSSSSDDSFSSSRSSSSDSDDSGGGGSFGGGGASDKW